MRHNMSHTKILSLLLAVLLLCLCMIACDPGTDSEESATTTQESTNVEVQTTTAAAQTTTAATTKDVTLKIATFNIHNGANVEYQYPILANDFKLHKLDIVGLQEVDMNTERNGKQDPLKIIAEKSELKHYVFAPAMEYQGGEYGIAVMSKYPILSHNIVKLPLAEGETEPRLMMHTVIDIDGYEFDFFVTHGSVKKAQEQMITANTYTVKCDAFVYLGDFNTDNFDMFKVFANSYIVNNDETRFVTTMSGNDYAFDNMVISKNIKSDKVEAVVTGHSDHKMLKAEITLTVPA